MVFFVGGSGADGIRGYGLLIWFVGRRAGLPAQARGLMLGLLYIAVLIAQVALPDGNPVREMTGREAEPWILVGILAGVAWGYARILKRIKARAGPGVPVKITSPVTRVVMCER